MQGEIPIWSIFWSKSGDSEKDGDEEEKNEDVDVQMVYLRPVDRTVEGEENRDGGEDSGASRALGFGYWYGVVVSVGVGIVAYGMF